MKKIIVAILLVGTLLAGCGGRVASFGKPVKTTQTTPKKAVTIHL